MSDLTCRTRSWRTLFTSSRDSSITRHYLLNGAHTLAGKILFGLVDTVVTKESRDEAVRAVTLLLEIAVARFEAAVAVLLEVMERIEIAKKGEEDNTLVHVVESGRPIAPAVYATEAPQDVLNGKS